MEPPVPRARKSYSQIAGRRVAGGGALWISTSTIACIGDSARAAAAAAAAGFKSSTAGLSTSSSAVNSIFSDGCARARCGRPWIALCTAPPIESDLFVLLRHRKKPPASTTSAPKNRPTAAPAPPPASLALPVGVDACGPGVGAVSSVSMP